MTGFECFYATVTDMGHGSQAAGHGSQFRWVTLLDPLPALQWATVSVCYMPCCPVLLPLYCYVIVSFKRNKI